MRVTAPEDRFYIRSKTDPNLFFNPHADTKKEKFGQWSCDFGDMKRAEHALFRLNADRAMGAEWPECEIFHVRFEATLQEPASPALPLKYRLATAVRPYIVNVFRGVGRAGKRIESARMLIESHYDGQPLLAVCRQEYKTGEVAREGGWPAYSNWGILFDDGALMHLRMMFDGVFPFEIINLDQIVEAEC